MQRATKCSVTEPARADKYHGLASRLQLAAAAQVELVIEEAKRSAQGKAKEERASAMEAKAKLTELKKAREENGGQTNFLAIKVAAATRMSRMRSRGEGYEEVFWDYNNKAVKARQSKAAVERAKEQVWLEAAQIAAHCLRLPLTAFDDRYPTCQALLKFLESENGDKAVQLILREECKVFAKQSCFQYFVNITWYGRLWGFDHTIEKKLDRVLSAVGFASESRNNFDRNNRIAVVWLLVIPLLACASLVCHVLVGPLIFLVVAIWPPLMDRAKAYGGEARDDDERSLRWTLVGMLYLLDLPCVKFWLSIALELALAIFFTIARTESFNFLDGEPTSDDWRVTWRVLLYVWAVSGILWEVRQLFIAAEGEDVDKNRHWVVQLYQRMSGGIREYWSDRFNRYDLLADVLTLIFVCRIQNAEDGVSITAAWYDQPKVVHVIRGVGALFLWLRLKRILLVFSRVGPYAYAVFEMMNDVASYGAILAVYPISYAALLSAVNEPPSSKGPSSLDWLPAPQFEPLLGSAAECSGWFDSFPNAFVFLLERAVTGESFFECAYESENAVVNWVIAFWYTTTTGLLLLNMLIAMVRETVPSQSHAPRRAASHTHARSLLTASHFGSRRITWADGQVV